MDDDIYEFPLTLRVPKSAFVVVAPEPATVTQRTVEQHFGIPPRMYKNLVRDGLFPVKRIGRLIFATYDDVKRAVTEGGVAKARIQKAVTRAVAEPQTAPMAVDAAITYLATARTKVEERQRKREVSQAGHDLMSRFGEKLDDDSPNPKYDKKLYDHGMDLLFASMGLRRKGEMPAGSTQRHPTSGKGYSSKCCWCDRPAYATKQTWDAEKWGWCGGPVCEVCARNRAANERVVTLESRSILLRARDPDVPTEYDAPRRRRKR